MGHSLHTKDLISLKHLLILPVHSILLFKNFTLIRAYEFKLFINLPDTIFTSGVAACNLPDDVLLWAPY